ncbi:unnamed protein product [Polarella glacialis]|uniref:Superoxide dismutase copper/zinc binding domain-containing protein n=1 Tax=Polarella glacialis TaxID=89957 RepID=A0A813FKJ5_POLGL|nr:unnamed protein product [Polarella glacialis]
MYATVNGKASATDVTIATGLTNQEVADRVVIIHDATGARISCIPVSIGSPGGLVSSYVVSYPGYTGNLSVMGSLQFSPEGSDASQILSYEITGGDASCGTANVTGIANACGIHIHVGTNCSDASTIGGHFWNKTLYSTDPWQSVMYATENGKASAADVTIATGLTNQEVADRVVIIHDATGARISCSQMYFYKQPPAQTSTAATTATTTATATATTATTTTTSAQMNALISRATTLKAGSKAWLLFALASAAFLS